MQVNTALLSFLADRGAAVNIYLPTLIEFTATKDRCVHGRICPEGASSVIVFNLGAYPHLSRAEVKKIRPRLPNSWLRSVDGDLQGTTHVSWATRFEHLPATPEGVEEVFEPVFTELSRLQEWLEEESGRIEADLSAFARL